MSRTLKTCVCFGVLLEDIEQLPWNKAKYDYMIDVWWIDYICGFKPSVEIYDENGNYLKDTTAEQIPIYIEERTKFEQQYPLPLNVVVYGFGDDPQLILSPCELTHHSWEDPIKLNDISLVVEWTQILLIIDFCKEHNIKYKEDPTWYAVSYSD